MIIKIFLAAVFCRLGVLAARILGKGGTDFPGRIALRICPRILEILAKDVKTVIVTGTNGKTTTSRIIEEGFKESGREYFANRSGANLLSGVTTCFIQNSTLFGKKKKDWAVIECDEAAFRTVSLYIKPECLAVTNIFRDQLDRYGEITHTLNSIRTGIEHIPQSVLCLNCDCSLTLSLKDDVPNPIVLFGVDVPIYQSRVTDLSDAPYCIHCKSKYSYDWTTFGHLGGFKCENCGYHRPNADFAVEKIYSSNDSSSEISISIRGEKRDVRVNLGGGYNIYNACAAAACLSTVGVDSDTVVSTLTSFQGGFGRMEKFEINGRDVRMILVKNPAGCNQVLNFLSGHEKPALFIICLNDRSADGTDVSWIWDVEFENLVKNKDRLTGLWVSGVRADDMAMRLKYAGFGESEIRIVRDYDKLIDDAAAQEADVYIMPTYTAMMDLRGRISKRFNFKEFWR